MENNTDPFTTDGNLDPVGDGFDNYSEWRALTNPHNASGDLKLNAAVVGNDGESKFIKSSVHVQPAANSGFIFRPTLWPTAP